MTRVSKYNAAKTWLVSIEIEFNVSRFEPALNWNRFLSVQWRGLNSLNSASGFFGTCIFPFIFLIYLNVFIFLLSRPHLYKIFLSKLYLNLQFFCKINFRIKINSIKMNFVQIIQWSKSGITNIWRKSNNSFFKNF